MTPRRRQAADAPRLVAYRLLRAVDADSAYANLALPRLIRAENLDGRDAALATELGYGTVRAAGTLDAVLAACLDRPAQPEVRDLLRLGAYQLLRTRVPPHAAVSTTVELARSVGAGRAAGLVNAVLRKVSATSWDRWVDRLADPGDPLGRLALRTAHPRWIAAAFADALGEHADLPQTAAALAADDDRPQTHLVAWPGRCERAELLHLPGAEPAPYSGFGVRLRGGGDPGDIPAVRERRAGVQDEGSQLCALALADTPLDGSDERWLDLCAGPGGKTALLAALAAGRGATVTANELRPHRADLVRAVTAPWQVEVQVGDARELAAVDGGYDRVLVDAPCTGLGALRRRPEARWRRDPSDLPALSALQRRLLDAALRLVRPGGLVAYVTCSPHLAETRDVVAGHDLLDARPSFPGIDQLGNGPTVQLWPFRHGTDAMFCALLRR